LPSGGSTCISCPGSNSASCDNTGTTLTCVSIYYLYNRVCYT
jgi:hypothetical protein